MDQNHSSPDKLKDDFSEMFGVNVKQEGDLFLFKYGLITSNWQSLVTWECRGSILEFSDNGWDFKSRPFDKFFNQHEGHCPIFHSEAFRKILPKSVLAAKADGSCIQLWHDGENWRASTLGTITTLIVQESTLTFEQLFLKTSDHIFFDELNPDITYIFELCTEENRIVTQYPADHVVLLGARNRLTGAYLSDIELDHEINNGAFREANIVLPQTVYPWELGLRNLSDVRLFVEESSKTDKYGKYPEGFVLYDSENFCPLAKLKNMQYVSLHGFGGGDINHSKNQIIDAVFLGFVDDIYDVLSTNLKKFADDTKHDAAKVVNNVLVSAEKVGKNDFATRKDYAMFVQQHIEKEVQPFFFQNAQAFMEKKMSNDVSQKFELWLKDNYKRFEWKNKS